MTATNTLKGILGKSAKAIRAIEGSSDTIHFPDFPLRILHTAFEDVTTTDNPATLTNNKWDELQGLTIKGNTVVQDGQLVSVGDSGSVSVTVGGKNLLRVRDYNGTYYANAGSVFKLINDYLLADYEKSEEEIVYKCIHAWQNRSIVSDTLKAGVYTLKMSLYADNSCMAYSVYIVDKDYIIISRIAGGQSQNRNNGWSINSPKTISETLSIEEGCRVAIYIANNGTDEVNSIHIVKPQLELGSTATEYEPYIEPTTYTIPTGTLRSAGTVADTVDCGTGEVTENVGVVDLGSLEWIKSSSGSGKFYGKASSLKYKKPGNMVCSKYTYCGSGGLKDGYYGDDKTIKSTSIEHEYSELYVHDDDYTNATDFKNAMQGVMLYYELDSPNQRDPITVPTITLPSVTPLIAATGAEGEPVPGLEATYVADTRSADEAVASEYSALMNV